MWVVDDGNDRILKYTYNGDFITAVVAPAVGDPRGIGADDRGFVYVVDRADDRVVKLTNGATVAARLGDAAPGDGFLDNADDVAVASDGTVYVTDGQIERFSADGDPLGALPGVTAGSSVAVAPDGTIYTLDGVTVQRHTPAGAEKGPPITLVPPFTGTPTGLAVDRAGDFYIGFVGDGEVARYTAAGALAERIGRDAAGAPILNALDGVAVDCRRNLYVSHTYAADSVNQSAVVKFGDPEAKNPPCAPPPPLPGNLAVQINDLEVTQGIQPPRTSVPNR